MNAVNELIALLKQIALKNYENGGDAMIECWDRQAWERFLADCGEWNTDPITSTFESMKDWKDYGDEIRATAF
jgi:hypothetical protein